MEVNRLLSDELSYELGVRGVFPEGSVAEKRQRLRGLLRLERLGVAPKSPPSVPVEVNEELAVCTLKLDGLEKEIQNFDYHNFENEKQRILSRLLHVVGRLNRLEPPDSATQLSLITRAGILCDDLEACAKPRSTSHTDRSPPEQHSILDEPNEPIASTSRVDLPIQQPRNVSVGRLVDVDAPVEDAQQQRVGFGSSPRHVDGSVRYPTMAPDDNFEDRLRRMTLHPSQSPLFPRSAHSMTPAKVFDTVSKWSLRFDGNSSVTNFIDGIEELRIACGITKYQLLDASIVLFSGTALSWFRAIRPSVLTWDELIEQLKSTFLPPEYDEEIWNEIRSRTQGAEEKTAIFAAVMESLFRKLSSPPSEATKLRKIRRNLLPHLQTQLALHQPNSVRELVDACRILEAVHQRTVNLRPPPTNPNSVLEPELMYRRPKSYPRANAVDTDPEQKMMALPEPGSAVKSSSTPQTARDASRPTAVNAKCWNCGATGHLYRQCRQSFRKHCFKCGKENHTVKTCPCSGNGSRSRAHVEP